MTKQSLQGINPQETRTERDTCTPVFVAALIIIARTWNQPRCLSADEWIRKQWYIYTMEYYSDIKKNIFQSVHKPERKTPIQHTNTYIWNLERW